MADAKPEVGSETEAFDVDAFVMAMESAPECGHVHRWREQSSTISNTAALSVETSVGATYYKAGEQFSPWVGDLGLVGDHIPQRGVDRRLCSFSLLLGFTDFDMRGEISQSLGDHRNDFVLGRAGQGADIDDEVNDIRDDVCLL